MKTLLKIAFLALLVCTFILYAHAPVFAQSNQCDDSKNEHIILDQGRVTRLSEYWTDERINSAQPKDIIRPDSSEITEDEILDTEEIPEINLRLSGLPQRADLDEAPYTYAGKLLFTLKGEDYSCSAQFTGAINILMTAAHCVRADTGEWATNVEFILGYTNEQGSTYAAKALATNNCWAIPKTKEDDFKWGFDVAFIKTTTNSTTGALGIKFAVPDSITSMGYPSNYEDGEFMYQVSGTRRTENGDVIQMKSNPMGKGSSGGAWTETEVESFVVGLNSYGRDNEPQVMYGPNFDVKTKSLFQYTTRL